MAEPRGHTSKSSMHWSMVNRELIARFEKKVLATLARVWGEDGPAAVEG